MIKLEIYVDNVDYNSVIDRYFSEISGGMSKSNSIFMSGSLPATLAKAKLKNMPTPKKEQFAAELINSNGRDIAVRFEEFLRQQNIRASIKNIKASAHQPPRN